MIRVYLYDDCFSSLLCLIFKLITIDVIPDKIVAKSLYELDLLSEAIDLEVNDKDFIKYKSNISFLIYKTIYYVFLSDLDNRELVIYYYLKNALKYGDEVNRYRNKKCVNLTLKYAHKVSREAHKLKGFLRFKKMNGDIYFGVINSSFYVLPLLVNHFKKRLKNEYFIIYDELRNIYAIYDKQKVNYVLGSDVLENSLILSNNEKEIEDLWKTFFATVSIKERKNLKCQMNFMPKKYWQNMIEMEDKL